LKETLGVFSELKKLLKPEPAPTVVTSDLSGWQAITNSVLQSLPQTLTGIASIIAAN
jgi:hypothetical protein